MPNIIDKVISAVSPAAGLKRQIARRRMELLAEYGGGRRDRANESWSPRGQSADTAIINSLGIRLARSRDLTQTTASGAAALRAFKRRVVGRGISPVPVVRIDGKELSDFNEKAAELFYDWANDASAVDIEGRKTFWEVQRLIACDLFAAGEHMIVKRIYRRNDGLPGFQLQCFEPEQLDTTMTSFNGNEVRHGIELNEYGAAIAYHFATKHPFDTMGFSTSLRSVRIEASRVYHIFDVERVRQSHGVPRPAPVMSRIRGMEAYDDATLQAARMEACIGLKITSANGGSEDIPGLVNPTGSDGTDADGNREVNFQPGMVFQGQPGETIDLLDPKRPGGQYAMYMESQQRAIGAGVGLGFGQLTMDFTKGTYSGQRQEMLEVNTETDVCQDIIISKFCDPFWRDFVTVCVLGGLLDVPDFFASPRVYTRVEWNGPPRPWIDPRNEAEAAIALIDKGLNSRTRVLNEMGHTVRGTFQQLANEQAIANEMGIKIGSEGEASAKPVGKSETPQDQAA